MQNRTLTVGFIPNIIHKIEGIVVSAGLARSAVVKGDTLEAWGEAGVGKFYVILIEEDKLKIEARNAQSLEIVENLVKVQLKEFYSEEKIISEKINEEYFCSECKVSLEIIGEKKEVCQGLLADVYCCPKCSKLYFYKKYAK